MMHDGRRGLAGSSFTTGGAVAATDTSAAVVGATLCGHDADADVDDDDVVVVVRVIVWVDEVVVGGVVAVKPTNDDTNGDDDDDGLGLRANNNGARVNA